MSALDRQVGGNHYEMEIEPIVFILANNLPFIEATVLRYIARWKNKNGVEDLKKAIHYLEILVEDVEANPERYGLGSTPVEENVYDKTMATVNNELKNLGWRYGEPGL